MEILFKGCPDIKLPKNSTVFARGDMIRHVYWLSEGLAEVYASNEEGKKQVIGYHYPDSLMAEVLAFSEEQAFLTCTTLKPTVVRRCDVDIFYERIQDMKLMRPYLKMLVGKAHANIALLTAVSLDDCRARINRFYNTELTHQQLSELCGCTRVQVTRVMNRKA